MIVLLTLGLVLIGVLIGGAGMRRAGQFARRIVGPWRPGIGVGALICLFGAAALASRGAVIEAVALAVVGVFLALGARLRRPAKTVSRDSGMSVDDARRILGVGPEAEPSAIDAAYRRLMRRAHPDLGGTSGLAAQLNAARETLSRP
jgi:hypothetical protein